MMSPSEISVSHPVFVDILGGGHCALEPAPETDPTKINTLIPVVFYGRSGTTLMGHLLDSHPNVVSIVNREFRLFFRLFPSVADKTAEDQLAWFIDLYGHDEELEGWIKHKFVETENGGVSHIPADVAYVRSRDDLAWPPSLPAIIRTFLSHTQHFKGPPSEVSLTAREFFLLFHSAYKAACGAPLGSDVKAVVWALHVPDPEVIELVAPLFERVRIIHCIRRPTQTLGSHFKRYYAPMEGHPSGELSPERAAVHVLKMLLSHDRRLSRRPNVEEFGVRLEDLHNNPDDTTARLAERLEIPWHPTLMQATYFGTPYVYKARNREIRTFDPSNLENQHFDIYEGRDLILIENLLAENYRRWGYDILTQLFPDEIRMNGLKMLALEPLKMEQLCWDKARAEGIAEDRIEEAKLLGRAVLYQRIESEPEIFDLL